MQMNVCYVVGAGENCGIDFIPQPGDYVIAADAGLTYLEQSGITANLVIGDFDTLRRKPNHPNVITLNEEKDDTDTFAAIQQGIEKGYTVFHLHGCTGGRIEHTIANIQLLAYLSENLMQGFLFDQHNIITTITNAKLTFPQYGKGYISVFSHSGKSEGVSLNGLKYRLDSATVTNAFPIGVSNEFIGSESVISVKKGTLIIVYPRKLGGLLSDEKSIKHCRV